MDHTISQHRDVVLDALDDLDAMAALTVLAETQANILAAAGVDEGSEAFAECVAMIGSFIAGRVGTLRKEFADEAAHMGLA